MRVLVLSDIHANRPALDAVLQNAPGYDAVWCLGDVVGYGPFPNECIARLRGLNALTLTGNHDQAVVGKIPLSIFNDAARAALEWTIKTITPENRAWLAERPARLIENQFNITLVHGSPRDPVNEYISSVSVAAANFPAFDTDYCLFGHTHCPIAYRQRAGERAVTEQLLPDAHQYLLEPRLLLNPGSVGQPRDGDPRASFVLLDTTSSLLTHFRVEYDIAATQHPMLDAGLPYRLAARLAQGV